MVVDANGTEVGHYLNGSGDVLAKAGADVFVLRVTRLGIPFSGRLLHLAADCSDTPNFGPATPGALAYLAQVSAGATWIVDRAGAPVSLPPGAAFYLRNIDPATGAVGACVAGPMSGGFTVLPLKAVSLPVFVPPLDLR
jgi:hypothetical protein